MQLTKSKNIRFTDVQMQSLYKLQSYNVNINQFIRDAIKEKIKRDWPQIKQEHTKDKLPF